MKKMQNSTDETANGKFVIIKVPRESLQKSIFSYILADVPLENFRRAVWIFICALCLLIGLALGAVFHTHLLQESVDKPAWKSSNLISTDRK